MKNFITLLSVFLVGSLISLGIAYAIYTPLKVFPDVNYNAYYGDSLKIMQERGVISGYSNGKFGPNDAVTRAQIVTILNKYEDSLFNQAYPNKTTELLNLICIGIDESKFSVNQNLQELYKQFCEQQVLL
ncbi:S-layer homology domain-containing protein [Candidatus Peregrinibacteria bacterium]|nr:S-layer homology domain-containing protein [Candidatus Peregrinibacteria bacterium]